MNIIRGYKVNRLKHLDGLKLIFCLWVVIYHYWDVLSNRDMSMCFQLLPEKFYSRGNLGVEFFFLLSGFLISYNYKERLTNGEISILFFLKKRIIAIYPMYFVACTLGVIVNFIGNKPITVIDLILSYTMTSIGWFTYRYPYGVAIWFVNVLFLCYIVYAFICKYSKRRSVFLTSLVAMAMIGVFCLLKDGNIPFMFFVNGRGYLSFFVGCLLYEVQNSLDDEILSLITYICVTLLIILFIVNKRLGMFNIFKYKDLTFPIIIYPILLLMVSNVTIIRKFFENEVMGKISCLSTSIYFVNYTSMEFLRVITNKINYNLDYSRAYMFLGVVVMVVMVAICYKILIEDKLTGYVKGKMSL